jgi:hypothetical protein
MRVVSVFSLRPEVTMGKSTLLALAALALLAGCGDQTLVAGLFVNIPATSGPTPTGPMSYGPYTAVLGYLTTINTSDITDLSSASITPITGAQVSLSFEDCSGVMDTPAAPMAFEQCVSSGHGGTDEVLSVADSGNGLYELLSTDNSALTFQTGVTYTLIMQVPDGNSTDAYGARFQPGPPAHMAEFTDPSTGEAQVVPVTAGSSLTVHRDDAMVDGEYTPAAVLVFQIDPTDPMPPDFTNSSSVWSSFDYTDPKTLALFALSDQGYRVSSFTIPSSVFASSGYYVVTMISITEGTASANAFIGSTALAGSGESGLVIVQ